MRHGRRDTTHASIRAGLRSVGVVVHDTGDAGNDFPDLVCGWKGTTYLLECKSGKGKESDGQAAARAAWRGGPWAVVHSLDEALLALGIVDDSVRRLRAMLGA